LCIQHNVNQCVSYYSQSQIPALSALANAYVVSDHTFSLQNSPSWTGHMAIAAATQDNFYGSIPVATPGVKAGPGWGCNSNKVTKWTDPKTGQSSIVPSCIPAPAGFLDPQQYPYNGPFRASPVPYVPTIFDRLDAQHLSWKIYATVVGWSICPTFAECQYGPQHSNVVAPAQILQDAKLGHLPAYSALNPSGPGGAGSLGTGQHPPGSMLSGDNWIGKVMNALQSGPEWSSTAVFITYDDCGCFYDHVPPGTNPDGTPQGIREPMVIVSPYAKRGATDSNPATFASILRFAEETFGLQPLSVNDAQAYDYANSFNFAAKPTGPRVVSHEHPVPQSTLRQLAKMPPDENDPT
jgi:phospholipase C